MARIRAISSDLSSSTIADLVPRLRSRQVSAEAVVQACLARVEARESEVKAWAFIDAELALRQARNLDQSIVRGPLHGIPIAVKDIFDTFDMPTCNGSVIHAERQPDADAPVVAMLREAGAVILGKTVTTEFAYFHPGPTVNPHDASRTPGGSSSGSAAAVAAGMAPVGLGSQTAASVIRPASFCGVVGYKSRLGCFPMSGVSPLARSLDSFGWMTRSVADAAIVFAALSGLDIEFDIAPEVSPSVGVCRTPVWEKADGDMQALLETTAERLAAAGAGVVDVVLPPLFERLVDAQKTVMAFETAQAMADLRRRHGGQLSRRLMDLLEEGAATDYGDYRGALALAERGRIELQSLAHDVDVLIAPSACGEAPVGLEATGDPIFSRMWTLLGSPCISLPMGLGSNGMPLGLQLIGPMHDEEALFRAASWVEKVREAVH